MGLTHSILTAKQPFFHFGNFQVYLSIFKNWTQLSLKIHILFYIKDGQSNLKATSSLKYKKYIN